MNIPAESTDWLKWASLWDIHNHETVDIVVIQNRNISANWLTLIEWCALDLSYGIFKNQIFPSIVSRPNLTLSCDLADCSVLLNWDYRTTASCGGILASIRLAIALFCPSNLEGRSTPGYIVTTDFQSNNFIRSVERSWGIFSRWQQE